MQGATLLLDKFNRDAVFFILNTIEQEIGAQFDKQYMSNGTALDMQQSFVLRPEAHGFHQQSKQLCLNSSSGHKWLLNA